MRKKILILNSSTSYFSPWDSRNTIGEDLMNPESIFKQIQLLPPEAQEEVADFVAFLRSKFAIVSQPKKGKKKSVLDFKFVGMWADREDMKDSSQWVRNLRENEWKRTRG